jgi:streptomycin 6-kinase
VSEPAQTADEALRPWIAAWALVPDGATFTTRFGSHLAPVLAEGAPAMLKVAGSDEERRGGALIDWYGGDGAARVLARAGEAILLERAAGLRSLAGMAATGDDDGASRIICKTIARLHAPRAAPPPDTLVPLPIWFQALGPAAAAHGGVFAGSLAAADRLLSDPREPVVLHGDVHHDNILDGGPRGWLERGPF